ncbi:hypothetical protein CAEBREN_00641 [Caenorhabditis brenneri]|uniref:Uncharacterized protein n=1 Tax=Caenorhabditis brenneri TaxID=135651 RepID=G0N2H7_CAEBE|nr:hypothetical protein CAEBREN_00641 [Caenorhabditis brenneri]
MTTDSLAVHLGTSAAIPVKRATAEEKEENVKTLNKHRLDYAKEHNIGNMHEVSYDSGLEKIAEEMGASCKIKQGSYILISIHLTTSAKFIEKRIVDFDTKEESAKGFNEGRLKYAKDNNIGNMHELSFDSGLENIALEIADSCKIGKGPFIIVSKEQFHEKAKEIMHPLQTQFACMKLDKPCPEINVEEGFCLYGPSNEKFSKKLIKKGALGSHCDHGVADNGLCKAGPKSGSNSQLNFWIFAVIAAFVMIFY